jgi:hypothetical protein
MPSMPLELRERIEKLWQALELNPCEPQLYLTLADLYRAQSPDSPWADCLTELATLPGPGHEREAGPTPEIAERLRPFRLLMDLRRQAPAEIDPQLIDEVREHAGACVPILERALRELAPSEEETDELAACFLAALVGEFGGPEAVACLVELSVSDRPWLPPHAEWAVWRIGRRFPEAAVAALRSAIPGASVAVRCAIGEQLAVAPKGPAIAPALLELLDGFEELPKVHGAVHLLAGVAGSLRAIGEAELSRQSLERYARFLPARDRKELEPLHEELSEQEDPDELEIDDICLERVFLEEDEEDDGGPPAVRPGRNEPCWCGSGKKYKKCHLAEDEEYDRLMAEAEEDEEDEEYEDEEEEPSGDEPPGDPDFGRLYAELLRSSLEWRKSSELPRAARIYFDDPNEIGEEEVADSGFFEWYLYDYRPGTNGRTMVEELLGRRGAHLPARDREILEAWQNTSFGLYEVQRIEGGRGVELKDLSTGNLFFVDDVGTSRTLVLGDCLLARVETLDGRHAFTGSATAVPRSVLEPLLERIESERRETGQSAADFVRSNSHRMHRIVEELEEETPGLP